MEQIFDNRKLNVSVRTVRWGEGILFYGKDVAESLGYADPKKAVRKHVWLKNKTTIGESTKRDNLSLLLKGHPGKGDDLSLLLKGHPSTVLIMEQGLYQLLFKSKLPIAEAFQDWVINEVLPSIRKTGQYKVPENNQICGNQMMLKNETDLHYAVVKYIRKYHPEAQIIPGLGEYQKTSGLRCDAWKKGYKGGQPDIVLMNACNGFHGYVLELKTPKSNGVLRENQRLLLKSLNDGGYQTLISDDYTEIILDLAEYFREN
ncbi:Hypothetical predicted protein [Paramuricea clavata]|uniref:Uncharacterized protein n=1 Tax=Paramuricea clavata TaxID=317549 RepID=A0A7D9DG43_PARCT|nr:Hypothetical predicted protein [Paramuricea clavata]